MRILVALLLACISCCATVHCENACAQTNNAQETKTSTRQGDERGDVDKLFWIFLTTGKSTEGVDSEQIQTMQSAHLANFKRLAEKEQLLTAGPMNDPENKLRGIVIVKAKDGQELQEMFKPDPYVQRGYLKIEANQMQFDYGRVNTKITPQGLDEFRLIVIEKNMDGKADEPSTRPVSSDEILSAAASDNSLLLGISFVETARNRVALLIMPKPEDEETFNAKVQGLPGIKSGQFKTRAFPLFMGKGSLEPQAAEPTG